MSFLRRHAGLILAFCVIVPTYMFWTWTDQIGAIDSDGPSYLLMAQHYSSHAVDGSVTSIAATFSRFPPLYPLALAYLHVAHDLRLAHAVTTVFFLLALVALYRWLLSEGLSREQASLLVLLFAAIPGSWLPGLTFQSEYLYLGCSLLALIAMSSFNEQRNNQTLYLAALAVAAAALTRTIGLTLFAPLLVVALRAPRGPATLALAIALAPLILWTAAHSQQHAYFGSLLATYDTHPLQQLMDQLSIERRALRFGFEQNFEQVPTSRLLLNLLGTLGLAGAAARACRLKPDGVYVIAYLCLLLLWPYPEETRRLIWPIIPSLLGHSILLVASWSAESANGRLARYAAAAIGGAILLGSLPAIALASGRVLSAGDFGRPEARGMLYWYEPDAARAERWVETEALITEALRRIDREIPQQNCVLSVRPELINYFSHRLSAYPPTASLSDPEFMRHLKILDCRYVFMVRRTYAGFPDSMYPLQRIAGHAQMMDHSELSPSRYGNDNLVAGLAALD